MDLLLPSRLSRLAALLLPLCLCACGGGDSPVTPKDGALPARVTDLAAVAGTATSVTLAWTTPGDATKAAGLRYDLRYVELGQESLDRAAWTAAPSPISLVQVGQRQQHVVAGLAAGVTYVFSLAASRDGTTWSEPSPPAVGTADPQVDRMRPAAVTDLVQFRGDDASVQVAWSPAGDDSLYGHAAGHELRWSTGPLTPGTWEAATPVAGPFTAHPNPAKLLATLDGLAPDQPVHVALVAVDDAGHRSALSNVITVQPGRMRTLYVKPDRSGDYPTIQSAVDAAQVGDVVLLAPGTYKWFEQGTGTALTGLVMVGGYKTDFTIRGEGGAALTILDAQSQGRVITVAGGSWLVGDVREFAGVTFEGLTLTHGRTVGVPGVDAPAGAGIALHLTDSIVRDCVFRANEAVNGGSVWMGGEGGSRLEGCLIEDSWADYGGGVMLINSTPRMRLERCTIRNNGATQAGGGVFAANVTVDMVDLAVYGNTCAVKGGGISLSGLNDDSRLTGCTIVDNAALIGGGLRGAGTMTVTLERCLVAFNTAGGAFDFDATATLRAGCGLVHGNAGGNAPPASYVDLGGNLAVDPLLCEDGHSPSPASPCLEANRAADGCGQVGAPGAGCDQ